MCPGRVIWILWRALSEAGAEEGDGVAAAGGFAAASAAGGFAAASAAAVGSDAAPFPAPPPPEGAEE